MRCGEGDHTAIIGKPALKKSRSTCSQYREEEREKAMKMFGKSILDRKVITAEGNSIGSVGNITFDIETGNVGGLIVNQQKEKGVGLKKGRISMNDVRLNMYSKNIVLKYTNYK